MHIGQRLFYFAGCLSFFFGIAQVIFICYTAIKIITDSVLPRWRLEPVGCVPLGDFFMFKYNALAGIF